MAVGTDTLRVVLTRSQVASLIDSQPDTSPIGVEDGWVFFYHGGADEVDLTIMEDRFSPVGPMARFGKSDMWFRHVEAPADSLIEYRLAIRNHGKVRHILDPANPSRARDPFGTNSVAFGHAYRAPSWLNEEANGGTVREFVLNSAVWKRSRKHLLYTPPDYNPTRPSPLLILHDGPDYLEYASFGRCMAVLTANERITPPLVLLHDPSQRHTEYADNPRHISHVIDEVLPALRTQHNIEKVVAGGASLGAVASLSMAYRRAGHIDGLMLQSGSFVEALGGRYQRGRVLAPAVSLTRQATAIPSALPDRMVLSCGTFDGLVEDNRRFVAAISEHVSELSYEEIRAGHHWLCWRDRLEPDLIASLTY